MFDEGNRTSVDAIQVLRDAADQAVARSERWPIILSPQGVLTEWPSVESNELQAADIAAGYARRLYEGDDGLKRVCLEFR